METKWYVATLIIRSRVEDQQPVTTWTCEEQIRLFTASDDVTAYHRAKQLGEAEAHSYQNTNGDTVVWEFLGVEELQVLDELADGVEVRSRLFGHPHPETLVYSEAQLALSEAPHLVHPYRFSNDDVL